MYDIIIIGGGLAGLECGSILSKEGMRVVVLDQADIAGGFFQPFKRRGVSIDSSIHYVGSLGEGQFMERVFNYLGIIKSLDLIKLDENGYDRIYVGDKCYPLAMGDDNFINCLAHYFPNDIEGIVAYVRSIRNTARLSIQSVSKRTGFSADIIESVTNPVNGFLTKFTSNGNLIDVLLGNSIIYCGEKSITPFYVHAMTSSSYIESAWRIRGGANRITDAMADTIRDNGGEVRCNSKVVEIMSSNAIVTGVKLSSGEVLTSKRVLSTIHPESTLSLLGPESGIKERYRKRVKSLHNSCSMFSLYLVMKRDSFRYHNSNFHIYGSQPIMISFQPPVDNMEYADVVSILTPMSFERVAKWGDTTTGMRDSEYRAFKDEYANFLLDRAETVLPGIKSAVSHYYTASPLTFRDYVKSPDGSIYGVMKDYTNPLTSFLSVRTGVKNLFLAGQSINLHGVMGVTITSLMACAEIVGSDFLKKLEID